MSNNFFPCQVQNVCMRVGNKDLFHNTNLDISDLPISSIYGPNGSGKSTLLKIIAGLVRPNIGVIKFNNKVRLNTSHYSFFFQKILFLNRSVFDNLYYVLCAKGFKHDYAIKLIYDHARDYDVNSLLKRNPINLSGGEQQIIAFIRSIITQPKVLFLDEPFLNLDSHFSDQIEDTLINLYKKTNTKILLISHDFQQVERISNEIFEIKNKSVIKIN